jgi:hypothetical protein
MATYYGRDKTNTVEGDALAAALVSLVVTAENLPMALEALGKTLMQVGLHDHEHQEGEICSLLLGASGIVVAKIEEAIPILTDQELVAVFGGFLCGLCLTLREEETKE